MTYLESFGFTSMAAFDTYVTGNGPSEYIESVPTYYGCAISATKTVIAIFAIMMTGEGLGMIEAPLAAITLAQQVRHLPGISQASHRHLTGISHASPRHLPGISQASPMRLPCISRAPPHRHRLR